MAGLDLYLILGCVFGLAGLYVMYLWYDHTVNRNPFAFKRGVKTKKLIMLAPDGRRVDWEDYIYDVKVADGIAFIPELKLTIKGVDCTGLEKKHVIFGYRLDRETLAPVYLVNVPILSKNYDEYKEIYAKEVKDLENRMKLVLDAEQGKTIDPTKTIQGSLALMKEYGAPAMLFFNFAEYLDLLNVHKERDLLDSQKKEAGVPEDFGEKIKRNASLIFAIMGIVLLFVMIAFFTFSQVQAMSAGYALPFQQIDSCRQSEAMWKDNFIKCSYGNMTNLTLPGQGGSGPVDFWSTVIPKIG